MRGRATWSMVHRIHQWLAHIHHLFPPTTDRQHPRACADCARTYKYFHRQPSHTRLAVLMRVSEFRESLTSLFPSTLSFPSPHVFFWGLCMENADMRFPASVFSCSKRYYFIQNVVFFWHCAHPSSDSMRMELFVDIQLICLTIWMVQSIIP